MTTLSLSDYDSTPAATQMYTVVSARSLEQKGGQQYSSLAGQMTIIIFLTDNGMLSLTEINKRKEVEIKCGTCVVLRGTENCQVIEWETPNSFVEIMIDDHFLLRTLETLQLNFTCLKNIVTHYGPESGFDCVARRVVEKIGEGISSYASLVRNGFHCPAAARFILAMLLKGRKNTDFCFEMESPILRLPEPRFAKVAEYIDQRISSSIHVGELASIAAQSHFHFTRTFKARTGQSPHAYILEHRVRRAEHMLAESTLGLAQISQECGFSSQSHFSTAFKQHIGITPGQYRGLWIC
ncbi:AraC family transcriptional regulator [Pseudomonas migulae]|jgi:AraC-like DNA-binding protein|uniref:helix-turn-helix domain-containing protein n=1 Tax=Pseudomonas migulae TaxID=78543 RepID=UPI0020A14823|nr:AraC family transcriptional regulator [Pseudomonas migulae]MCP1496940.1 AraC family transcriptional regulator [Pseudomonas migulae]